MHDDRENRVKSGDIAILHDPVMEAGELITLIKIQDPRKSLVRSIHGDVPIVLSRDQRQKMVNLDNKVQAVDDQNYRDVVQQLPEQVTIFEPENTKYAALIFSDDDFNEVDSVLFSIESPSVLNAVTDLIESSHSKSTIEDELLESLSELEGLFPDDVVASNEIEPTLGRK